MDICDRADGRDRPKEGVARIMAGLVLPTLLRSRALLRNPYAGGCAVRFVSRYATRPAATITVDTPSGPGLASPVGENGACSAMP